MPITTHTITATISEPDGTLLENARVVIALRGLGNGANGAVAPMSIEKVTDANGIATFTLWENDSLNSDTYYEISSFHPVLGSPIHNRERFLVFDSDADVKDLINVSPVSIDPNQALLDQVAADRAAAAASATAAATSATSSATSATSSGNSASSSAASASSSASSATQALAALNATLQAAASIESFPSVYNQHVQVVQSINRIINLGPAQTPGGEDITYEVIGSIDVDIAANFATFNSNTIGQQILTVIATDESDRTTQVLIIIDVIDPNDVTEFSLSNVQVA